MDDRPRDDSGIRIHSQQRRRAYSPPAAGGSRHTPDVGAETMKIHGILFLVLILATPVRANSNEIPVSKVYTGIIDISAPFTGDLPPENDEEFEPLLVIRTSQAYDDFLKRIPVMGVSQGSPRPRNDDPLLQKPKIDFTRQMLVVVVQASMDGPEIRTVRRSAGKIVLMVEFPDNGLPRPYGTGTYQAVLIPSAKEEVVVQTVETKKNQEPQPEPDGDGLKPAPKT